jgi:hypothetical protein
MRPPCDGGRISLFGKGWRVTKTFKGMSDRVSPDRDGRVYDAFYRHQHSG